MSKFTNAIKAALKAYFETGDTPTEDEFAEIFDCIQQGIEEHEHSASGGAGSGAGDADQVDQDGINLTSKAEEGGKAVRYQEWIEDHDADGRHRLIRLFSPDGWDENDIETGNDGKLRFYANAKGAGMVAMCIDDESKNIGHGTENPARRVHDMVHAMVSSVIIIARRLTGHIPGSFVHPEAGFGVGEEHELEDSSDTLRIASARETLWAEADYLSLTRGYGTDGGATPGYWGNIALKGVSDTARTIIPDIVGDVSTVLTVMYAVAESAGGTSGGVETVASGNSVTLYDDGTDVLTLSVAADGSVTLQRTTGAATFDIVLRMCWI